MSQVRGIKVNLEQIMNSDAPDASSRHWVTPKKATILSRNYGTLVETEENEYFIVPVGEWFRSSYFGKALPQVDDFDKLQDLGLTAIKDKIVRNNLPAKKENTVKSDGQKIRRKDNVSFKKAGSAMAPNSRSSKKD